MKNAQHLVAGAGISLCWCAQSVHNSPEVKPAEDPGALDRLAAQALKEETNPIAEPGGIGAR